MYDTKIYVEVAHAGPQPLITVFEANVDLDGVIVQHNEYAIKATTTLSFVISAVSSYVFKKLVLDPLLGPVLDKFDWSKAVSKYLKPEQPFSLVVQLHQERLSIETSDIYDQSITADIWNIINKTLDILKSESLIGTVTKVRFATSKDIS